MNPLERVSEASRRRDLARAEYRAAVQAASCAGYSQVAIARAAAVNQQSVSRMLARIRQRGETT